MKKLSKRKKFYLWAVLGAFLFPLTFWPVVCVFSFWITGELPWANFDKLGNPFGFTAFATIIGAILYAPLAAILAMLILAFPAKQLSLIAFASPFLFALGVLIVDEWIALIALVISGTYVLAMRLWKRKLERRGYFIED